MVNLGYYFESESDAIAARDACDSLYGCPIGDMTHWCSIEPWGAGFAIIYDESLDAVLGMPSVLPTFLDADDLGQYITPQILSAITGLP